MREKEKARTCGPRPLRTRVHAEAATTYTSLARGRTLIATKACVELHYNALLLHSCVRDKIPA